MANFTPDEMAAINEMAKSGQMSDQEVRYFLSQMGAPMMPPTGAGATTDMEMQALQKAKATAGKMSQASSLIDALLAGKMRPTGAGSTSDMEMQVLMELLQRPGVADMLGALPSRGAITDQEMQGVK
jgi:hypothetical protein